MTWLLTAYFLGLVYVSITGVPMWVRALSERLGHGLP